MPVVDPRTALDYPWLETDERIKSHEKAAVLAFEEAVYGRTKIVGICSVCGIRFFGEQKKNALTWLPKSMWGCLVPLKTHCIDPLALSKTPDLIS